MKGCALLISGMLLGLLLPLLWEMGEGHEEWRRQNELHRPGNAGRVQ